MTYDTKCHDLALVFLSDIKDLTDERRAKLADELAQEIQRTIEDFLNAEISP